MQMPNLLKRLPPETLFAGRMTDELEKAASCAQCGECEKRCPFNLPIPDMVSEYNTLFRAEKRKWGARSGGSKIEFGSSCPQ